MVAHKELISLTEDHSVQATLKTLLDPYVYYVRSYWFNQVTPKRISVYKLPHTTNGGMERYHRTLKP